jgi:hypothetical protein
MAHFDGSVWSVERPLGAGLYFDAVSGDTDGRVAASANDRIYLREGGAWRELPGPDTYSGLWGATFLGGRLLAWNSWRWYNWDGAAWIEEGDFDVYPYRCVIVGSDLAILSSGGEVVCLAGGEMNVLLPALGSIVDFETTPDGAVILTSNRWIIRETATGWVPDVQLSEYGSSFTGWGRYLIRTASGSLMALVSGGLYREREGGWESLTIGGGSSWVELFPPRDDTLWLWGSSGLWAWSSGRLAFLCAPPQAWGDLKGVAGDSTAGARFLFSDLLARYDGVTLRPVADRLSAEIYTLGYDPDEGLLLAGRDGLFAGDGAATRDLTPRCEIGVTPARAVIQDFTVTPSGDWLAWTDAGQLLRRRAGLWQSLDGAEGSPLPNWGPAGFGRSIRGGAAGDVWLVSQSRVYRYREAAPRGGGT